MLAFKVSNSAQFFTLEDTMLGVQCMCLKSIVYVTRFQFISASSWQGVVWSETAGSLVTCNSFYNISPDHSNNLHSISSTTLSKMHSIQEKKYLKHLNILLKTLLNKDKVKTVLEDTFLLGILILTKNEKVCDIKYFLWIVWSGCK